MTRIGDHDIDEQVLIIAEIGNNHEGDVALAEELIGLASEVGADAVKFQTIVPELLTAPEQQERIAQLRRFALTEEHFERLSEVAHDQGVMFLTTPFSETVVPLVERLCPAVKVASGDNDHILLLRAIAATGLPVILSTGMCDLAQVGTAVDALEAVWSDVGQDPGLVLLHCVSAYPTPDADANLRAIVTLGAFGRPVGYSDHTMGADAAVAAVAVGARVIEKHFTDRHNRSEFRDHALSADPDEFRDLVRRIRETEVLLGEGVKRLMSSEEGTTSAARRSLHTSRPLRAGHVVGPDDLIGLRPGSGISVAQADGLIGRCVARDLPAMHRLQSGDVH